MSWNFTPDENQKIIRIRQSLLGEEGFWKDKDLRERAARIKEIKDTIFQVSYYIV